MLVYHTLYMNEKDVIYSSTYYNTYNSKVIVIKYRYLIFIILSIFTHTHDIMDINS